MRKYNLVAGFIGFLFLLSLSCDKNETTPTVKNGIVFSSTMSGNWDLGLMWEGQEEIKQITNTPLVDERFPCWYPKQQFIYYRINEGDILRKTIGDKVPEKIVLHKKGVNTNPSISPDGKLLLYVNYTIKGTDEDGDIFVFDIAGNKATKIIDLPGHQFNPSWSSDGEKFVFMSGNNHGSYDIWISSKDGKDVNNIIKSDFFDNQPDLSPDGTKIIFCSTRSGNADIWLYDLKTSELKQLTQSSNVDEYPKWSPDGKQILFVSSRSGRFHAWLMDSNGSNKRQVTLGDFHVRDANWIYFKKGDRTNANK